MVKALNLVCLNIGLAAFILNLAAYSSNSWWVARRPQEFERIGLWEICFNHYRHRFDYYGKIYTGCWWIQSPEIRMLFSWLSTPWYRSVQAFSTLACVSLLFSVILLFMLTFKEVGKTSTRFIISTALLLVTSAVFMTIAVIIFGTRGKDRDWMPRYQQCWFGWSFSVAIVSCLLTYLSGCLLLFEGVNMKLVKLYVEKMYILKQKKFPNAPSFK
jgi:hypothetical protein